MSRLRRYKLGNTVAYHGLWHLTAALLVLVTNSASAQRASPSGLTRFVDGRSSTALALAQSQRLVLQSCAYWIVFAWGGGGVAVGWFAGAFTGLLGSDPERMRKDRRKFMVVGGIVGTAIGIVEAVRGECITVASGPRHEQLLLPSASVLSGSK
jgi:hypothetical protein